MNSPERSGVTPSSSGLKGSAHKRGNLRLERVTSTYPNGTDPTVGPRSWTFTRPLYGCGGYRLGSFLGTPAPYPLEVVTVACGRLPLCDALPGCQLISLEILSRVPLPERLTLERCLAMTHIDSSVDQS